MRWERRLTFDRAVPCLLHVAAGTALKGDLAGRFSIRVNDRYRICFEWRGEDAWEVEIVDYH